MTTLFPPKGVSGMARSVELLPAGVPVPVSPVVIAG